MIRVNSIQFPYNIDKRDLNCTLSDVVSEVDTDKYKNIILQREGILYNIKVEDNIDSKEVFRVVSRKRYKSLELSDIEDNQSLLILDDGFEWEIADISDMFTPSTGSYFLIFDLNDSTTEMDVINLISSLSCRYGIKFIPHEQDEHTYLISLDSKYLKEINTVFKDIEKHSKEICTRWGIKNIECIRKYVKKKQYYDDWTD